MCLSVLFYWLIRLLFGTSWITYWLPLLIMTLLIIYIGLLSYFEQRIFNVLVKVVEEGFNVDEVPKLLEHLSEACIADDIKDRISKRFVLSVIMIWFLYYALLFLAISIVDHYTIHYGGLSILTLLFDAYPIYTLTLLISMLIISGYLAYTKYVESEKTHREVFSEWVEELAENYTVNNCLKGGKRVKPSRILAIITPLMLISKKELLRPISLPFLPATLAGNRMEALVSSGRYSIEPLKSGKTIELRKLIEEITKPVAIEDLKKGILHCSKMFRIYDNQNNKELLGYLITLTVHPKSSEVLPLRPAKDNLFVGKFEEAVTYIYLLALHPRMTKFYMDLWFLGQKPNERLKS